MIYFSLKVGQLGNITCIATPDRIPFVIPELDYTTYYVTIRALNDFSGEESENINQLIIPICQSVRYIDENGDDNGLGGFMHV